MKIINPLVFFISSLLFLKEYSFNEKKLRIIKNRFPYLLAIWVLLSLPLIFPLPDFLGKLLEYTDFSLSILLYIVFLIWHLCTLVYISFFAKKHIAFSVLLIPMSLLLIWNLTLWNSPTYNGAMDGFANLMTAQMQLLILIILPTFMFSLRMVKIENNLKGILLLLITLTAGILGIRQCIGKEGYFSDSTGSGFAFLIILLFTIALPFIKPIKKI